MKRATHSMPKKTGPANRGPVKRATVVKPVYRLRFNLQPGKNYQKWALTYPSLAVRYFDPATVCIVLTHCRLVNSPATAARIYAGAGKSVCAWVEAEGAEVVKKKPCKTELAVRYNPRVQPNWQVVDMNGDNFLFSTIMTAGRKLYALP